MASRGQCWPALSRGLAPRRFAALLGCVVLLALAGCAQLVPQTIDLRSHWPAGVPRAVELHQVPFFPQTEYQCGPAALAIAMNHAGNRIRPEQLVGEVYLPARKGSLQVEMLAAPRRHGLVGWQTAPAYGALLRELAAGNPVLVLQDLGLGLLRKWHYAIVVGFDYEAGELYLRSGENRRQAMPFTVFELTWRGSEYWAMVVTRPDSLPATATESGYLPALLAFDRAATPAAARSAWQTFLARWPGNALASVALANRYYADRDLARAEAVLRQAAQAQPASPELLNNLAQVLSDQGRHAEALSIIAQAQAQPGPFAAEIAATREGILREQAR